ASCSSSKAGEGLMAQSRVELAVSESGQTWQTFSKEVSSTSRSSSKGTPSPGPDHPSLLLMGRLELPPNVRLRFLRLTARRGISNTGEELLL
ncbi:unnamed protein product, partial [Discosporangium mesarthrocarpum]